MSCSQLSSWVLPYFWWLDTALPWHRWLPTPHSLTLAHLRICVDLLLDFCHWTSHSWEEFTMVLLRQFMRLVTLVKNYRECSTRWPTPLCRLCWLVGQHLCYCLHLHWHYLMCYGRSLHLCLLSWLICKWIRSVSSMGWHQSGSADIEAILLQLTWRALPLCSQFTTPNVINYNVVTTPTASTTSSQLWN